MKFRAVIIGLGNIGSQLAGLLASMLSARRVPWELVLVDHDRYERGNLGAQAISQEDVGLNKAVAQSHKLRRVHRGLKITAHTCRLEELPLGEFEAAMVVTCLDSPGARLAACERVWSMGTDWIDTGVLADDRLARMSVFRPGAGAPCFACGLDDESFASLEVRRLCAGTPAAPATGAPAALGALAASLAALECEKLIEADRGNFAAGREFIISGTWHTHFVNVNRGDPDCRLPHEILSLETVDAPDPQTTTLGDFWSLLAPNEDSAMEVRGFPWVTRLICRSCGANEIALALQGRTAPSPAACAACGGELQPSGFHMSEAVRRNEVPRSLLVQPLSAAGVRRRDVISFQNPGASNRHFLLA